MLACNATTNTETEGWDFYLSRCQIITIHTTFIEIISVYFHIDEDDRNGLCVTLILNCTCYHFILVYRKCWYCTISIGMVSTYSPIGDMAAYLGVFIILLESVHDVWHFRELVVHHHLPETDINSAPYAFRLSHLTLSERWWFITIPLNVSERLIRYFPKDGGSSPSLWEFRVLNPNWLTLSERWWFITTFQNVPERQWVMLSAMLYTHSLSTIGTVVHCWAVFHIYPVDFPLGIGTAYIAIISHIVSHLL